jgi:NodT family efflux transporter outer membrane factor (OMF) lipoprotein
MLIRKSALPIVGLICLFVGTGRFFLMLPSGFLPDEDQGVFFAAVRLPDGASLERNQRVVEQAENAVKDLPGVEAVTTLGGLDMTTSTNNTNVSTIIVTLRPWEERKRRQLQQEAILGQAQMQFMQIKDAFIFGFGLPPILGLSTAGGFEFMLEDRAGGDIAQLATAAGTLVDASRRRPDLANVISTFRDGIPQFQVKLDVEKAQTLGIPVTHVYDSLQTFLGGLYVNDFNRFGRTWKVLIQADPEYRYRPEDIDRFYVRTAGGDMAPLSTLVTVKRVSGPEVVYRYNRFRTAEIMGQSPPGYSSGEAAKAMETLAGQTLPQGFGYEWTGTLFQQKLSEGKEGFMFGFAAVLVFLFLAARKLVHSFCGRARSAAWLIWGNAGGFSPILCVRPVHAGRHRDAHRPVREECNSHRGIRQAAPRGRQAGRGGSSRGGWFAAPADSDDVICIYSGRPSSGHSDRGWRRVEACPWNRGPGWNEHCDRADRVLRPGAFRGNRKSGRARQPPPCEGVCVQHRIGGSSPMNAQPLVSALVLFLSGCAVGPNYKRPAIEVPPEFRTPKPNPPSGVVSLADTKWFDVFQDDVLRQLIRTALRQNFDLRVAAERVLEARARLGIQRSALFPQIDAAGTFNAERASLIGANRFLPSGADLAASFTQAGFSLSWELDVWGRLRRLNESARAQYLATEAARLGVVTTLVSDVATAYFNLRELDLELSISHKTREVAEQGLKLTALRKSRGVATGLDLKQAEQLLYTATAQIAATKRAIAQAEDALSQLLGQNPSEISRGKSLEEVEIPPRVPPGLPSSLLERRPDIRQAELNLIAANAEIGAARAQYFPQISLTGFLGGQSRALSDLFTGPGRQWSVAPAAILPIFNAGRIRSEVRLSEAEEREALLSYQRSIVNAFREVSDAIVAYSETVEQRIQEQLFVDALRESDRLSRLRYEGGMDSYLHVLDAERSLFQGELVLAQLKRNEVLAVIELYRALGGGWS